MAKPQSGILPDASREACFLTMTIGEGASLPNVREAIAAIPGLTDAVAGADPDVALRSVVAIGASAWERLYPDARPAGLTPFQAFTDGPRTAPSTPADLLLHARAERRDLVFELTRRVRRQFGDAVALVEEVPGFRYRDSRDLTGFVDGTENPQGETDRRDVALVPGGPFAGGSFVHIQRYIHDLPAWEALPIPAQEAVIGRSKADDIEFEGDDLAPTAHIARVSIKEDGKSLKILRHSMPYGTTDEHGLYFASYAGRPDSFPRMLEAMIVPGADGHHDHLMNFSRAVTGAAFFAPSTDWLTANG